MAPPIFYITNAIFLLFLLLIYDLSKEIRRNAVNFLFMSFIVKKMPQEIKI